MCIACVDVVCGRLQRKRNPTFPNRAPTPPSLRGVRARVLAGWRERRFVCRSSPNFTGGAARQPAQRNSAGGRATQTKGAAKRRHHHLHCTETRQMNTRNIKHIYQSILYTFQLSNRRFLRTMSTTTIPPLVTNERKESHSTVHAASDASDASKSKNNRKGKQPWWARKKEKKEARSANEKKDITEANNATIPSTISKAPPPSRPPRVNHFVSLRMTNPDMISKMKNVQEQMLKNKYEFPVSL